LTTKNLLFSEVFFFNLRGFSPSTN